MSEVNGTTGEDAPVSSTADAVKKDDIASDKPSEGAGADIKLGATKTNGGATTEIVASSEPKLPSTNDKSNADEGDEEDDMKTPEEQEDDEEEKLFEKLEHDEEEEEATHPHDQPSDVKAAPKLLQKALEQGQVKPDDSEDEAEKKDESGDAPKSPEHKHARVGARAVHIMSLSVYVHSSLQLLFSPCLFWPRFHNTLF